MVVPGQRDWREGRQGGACIPHLTNIYATVLLEFSISMCYLSSLKKPSWGEEKAL